MFALNMLFLHLALWSGYLGAALTGLTAISLLEFVENVLHGMTLKDHLLLLIKPLVMGLVIAYIPIWLAGLRVEASALAVRQAMPRQFVYSLLATFLIGTMISAVL
ncbi:MAG: ABC transporter permease [Chromatiaceae bacterium]|nr:ABC transporter permease [Chromatiaceae bacterium]